ncbi:MAG TPA: ECF-type sigma factor [Vicinamibacteria bacterium]
MDAGAITRQLLAVRSGTPEAMDELFALVYEPLKAIARGKAWRGVRTPTLGATALVHEAYLRLVDQTQVDWNDRVHFFAVAARAMRQIAVDHERRRQAAKRGGGQVARSLDDVPAADAPALEDVLTVDAALERLAATSPRLVQVVELCFFAGLSTEEAAEVLRTSARTVKRDWRKAKMLLFQLIGAKGS